MCCDIQRHKFDAKSLKCANSPKKATSQPGAQKRASSESYFSTCYSRRKIVKMCCDIQRHKLDAKSLKCGNSPKKVTPQPGAQKRASSEGPTHQKKLLPNHLLKKVVLKGQLTKKRLRSNFFW